jgi:hypothetical protein
MPRPSAQKLAILQRRKQVAELFLQGCTQSVIAEKLGVKQPTVCDDLAHIRKAWEESQIRDYDAARTLQVERLRQVSREAWAGYERSQQPAQMATVDGANGSGKAKRTVRHQYGDPRFLDLVLKSIEAERQLMGLDAPTKIAPTTPDGRPLSREERLIHINAILIEKFGAATVLGNGDEKEVLEHDPTAGASTPGPDDRRGVDEGQPAFGACDTDPDTASTAS